MSTDLESPYENGTPRWEDLYRARAEEVSGMRPVFTGDVFANIRLPGRTGKEKARSVAVIQHPCSMRTNGVDLAWQVLVAEVKPRKILTEEEWATGNFNIMPLPDLRPEVDSQARHQAADFDSLYTVSPDLLKARIASLSPTGVNLLLQRWVHFSARVIVPTAKFHEQTVAFYEEADLVEDWCDDVASGDQAADARACLDWLRAAQEGPSYQDLLKQPQSHSTVRRAMRAALRTRRS